MHQLKPETGKKKESKLLIRNCLLMQKILSKILSIRPTKGLVSLDKILTWKVHLGSGSKF